jgi:hypothetical protein
MESQYTKIWDFKKPDVEWIPKVLIGEFHQLEEEAKIITCYCRPVIAINIEDIKDPR